MDHTAVRTSHQQIIQGHLLYAVCRHGIEDQFCESFSNCMVSARKRKLWLNAIKILKSDPTFDEISIDKIANNVFSKGMDKLSSSKTNQMRELFSTLSSGHKVVLLIVTCCVDTAFLCAAKQVVKSKKWAYSTLKAGKNKPIMIITKTRDFAKIRDERKPQFRTNLRFWPVLPMF